MSWVKDSEDLKLYRRLESSSKGMLFHELWEYFNLS